MKKTPVQAKHFDGKKKLVLLTAEMEADLADYCRLKGIESESELIRQAIAKYIYADYQDETLKLQGIKTMGAKLDDLRDMLDITIRYIKKTHINILAYHAEIEDELKEAAFNSATRRHEKFFEGFRRDLRHDPSFFEHLLHSYYTDGS